MSAALIKFPTFSIHNCNCLINSQLYLLLPPPTGTSLCASPLKPVFFPEGSLIEAEKISGKNARGTIFNANCVGVV